MTTHVVFWDYQPSAMCPLMSVAVGCQGSLQPRRDLENVVLIASFRLQAQVENLAWCLERDALQRDAIAIHKVIPDVVPHQIVQAQMLARPGYHQPRVLVVVRAVKL
eukprot:3420722-Pyramimonas_sp.AAC.1